MKLRTKIRLSVLAALITLSLVASFVVRPCIVAGESMTPTLRPWDLCFMRVVRHYQPHRGDIVVFRTADDPPLYFIKRVTALPGETISIERGIVGINGASLADLLAALELKFAAEQYTHEIRRPSPDSAEITVTGCPWMALMERSGRMHLTDRVANAICGGYVTAVDRNFHTILARTSLEILQEIRMGFGGLYFLYLLRKPLSPAR